MPHKGCSYVFTYDQDTFHPHKWYLTVFTPGDSETSQVFATIPITTNTAQVIVANRKTHGILLSSVRTPAGGSGNIHWRMRGCQHRGVHVILEDRTQPHPWGCWEIKKFLTGRTGFEVLIEIPCSDSIGPFQLHWSPLIKWYVSFSRQKTHGNSFLCVWFTV